MKRGAGGWRWLTMVVLIGGMAFVPLPLGGASHTSACPDGSDARFGGEYDGNLTLVTQAGDHHAGAGLHETHTGVVASTTGKMTLRVLHECLEAYTSTVNRLEFGITPGSEEVYRKTVASSHCGSGERFHDVPFGFDAGMFGFDLTAQACDGDSPRDYRIYIVVDPPLPLG